MEGGQARCQCPPYYLKTIPGILKIVEMVMTILTFALSFGGWWSYVGGGWVEFSGITSFIVITIWLILHLINIIPQFVVNFLIEFISYCVMTICLLISGIVAAAMSSKYNNSTIGACSFFAFAAMVACAIDAVLQFLQYRQGGSSGTTTTTTTTTTTSSAAKVEY